MIRIKSSTVLVVASATSFIPIQTNKQVMYITDTNRLFPAIHAMRPGGLVLDHDYLGEQTEKILRRMVFNPFYSKMKIYCYKTKPNTKVDALLKVLGVQQFIYAQDVQNQPKHVSAFKIIGDLLKTSVSSKLVDAGY